VSGPVEYAGAVAVGIALLLLRRNLSWAALGAVALDELIEAAVLAALVCAAHAKRAAKALAGRIG
jgi:hypothetical protein